ncbi:inosose dehydratase [Lipingzhangella halophila]|uniref:Inosose dehydratase n=1 Tax=Lipingzhangella halophila TaxID=1783352 RepID=A0A7W7RM04_9ACTN|nr:TIM barrel protein [Lipingzhangella halophila]MBB4934028.1 inosose dehydratase [Lipingzhangella halophila]
MATAAEPANNLVLGSAPDSWGVWFPDDEHQTPWYRFLDELSGAGYSWLELGPYGYLPTEPDRLADEVAKRGLRVSGGTAFGALHRADAWDDMLATMRKVAALTRAVGAHHLVFIPPMYRDEKTGEFSESPVLPDDAWRTVYRGANELGKILLNDYDVRLCLHSHADSHIQSQPEIERFLDGTDPDHVSLCLDTGHVAYGGGDAVDLIRRYSERVGYVHIKQMDPDVLAQVAREDLSFGEAVKRGVCVEPPAGEPAPDAVIDALEEVDARVFVIVEQDLYPCEFDVPQPIAIRTRKYLNSCGLGARHQKA